MSHAFADLLFLVEAGADEAIGEIALDRLRKIEPSPVPVAAPAPVQRPAPPEALQKNSDVVARARALAAAASDLDALKSAMENFDGCALRQTATQLVFADGAPGSKLIIIGEAPGRDEDLAGKPFVGRSGQLLDRMLDAIGLDRRSVYIVNVVPWRPPGNRKPTPAESQICRPFVERQIALSCAKVALLLGGAAVSALLQREDGIMKLRGRWFDLQADRISIPALATFHPAYLLRAPGEKRLAWRDFLTLRARLDSGEESVSKS